MCLASDFTFGVAADLDRGHGYDGSRYVGHAIGVKVETGFGFLYN
jgi:hypothetical protein